MRKIFIIISLFTTLFCSFESNAQILGSNQVCVGSAIILSDATAGGTWSSSNTNATVGTDGTVTGAIAGTCDILYTIGTDIATSTITINALPDAGTISGAAKFCGDGGTVPTYTSSVTGGIWSSLGTCLTVTDPAIGSGTIINTGIDTLFYTVNNGCSNTVSKGIRIDFTPAYIDIMNYTAMYSSITYLPNDMCLGTPTTLTATTGITGSSGSYIYYPIDYAYYGGSGGTGYPSYSGQNLFDYQYFSSTGGHLTIDSFGNTNGVSVGTDIITFKEANTCGVFTGTMNLTVDNIPDAGTILGATNVCVGGTPILLSDIVSGGTWSSSNTNATVGTDGTVTGVSFGTATITYTVTNNCTSAFTTLDITINTLPHAGTILGATSVCAGNATILLSDLVAGGTWSSSNTNATVDFVGTVTGVTAGNATITYTVTNTCGTVYATSDITINPLPNSGTVLGVTSVCAGNATILLSDISAGGTWSSSNTNASVGTDGTVTGITAGNATISYTVTNTCGTVYTTSDITINPLPAIPGAINGSSFNNICVGTNHTFTDAVAGGTWASTDVTYATVGTTGRVTGVLNGTVDIHYTIANGCGSNSVSQTITVTPQPVTGTITGVTALSRGGAITLSIVGTVVGVGTWSSCNSTIASIDAGGNVSGVGDGETIITWSVTNSCGTKRALATITVGDCSTASNITTVAGSHVNGYTGDGGAANAATMGNPWGVATDANGNIYIADYYNNAVRKVDAATGIMTTFAGTGVAGYNGDGIAASTAQLNGPAGITIDGSGNIYIADKFNERIRKINTSGIIHTIAGNGFHGGWQGHSDGNGGQATAASLDYPVSVALDCSGNIYIADWGSQSVRKINSSGIIKNFAGTFAGGYNGDGIAATSAKLWSPNSVAADCNGNVYISDSWNHRIRKVNASGIISTYAGNGAGTYAGDGGPATSASLWVPWQITLDGCDNMYICDWQNNAVRKVDASGNISTFVGTNQRGYDGDGAAATAAKMYLPSGLAIDGTGNVYISDYGNNVVRNLGTTAFRPRSFVSGTTQDLTVCENDNAVSINSLLAVPDNVAGKNITWTITETPLNGTLDGFNASVASREGTVTPTGLTYTPKVGFFGTDEFTILMNDGISKASTTINVNVTALPNPGTITGVTELITGSSSKLINTNGDKNGTWSSSDTTLAVVDATAKVTGLKTGMVTITYTVSNSCSKTNTTTGIMIADKALQIAKAVVFPNPNTGSFKYDFISATNCQMELSISDLLGRIIYKQNVAATIGANSINVNIPEELPNGSIVTIQLGNNSFQYDVVKMTILK